MQIFKSLFNGAISQGSLNRIKHLKCLESIQFANSNPVSDDRKIQGDIFYLTVRTLENPAYEHGITCTVNGFYRNESTQNQFNPLPSTKSSPCFSYTLVGCLNQLSPTFGKNLEIYFNSILNTEPFFMTQSQHPYTSWIQAPQTAVKVSQSEDLG